MITKPEAQFARRDHALRLALPMARVEARRLVFHPLMGIGILLSFAPFLVAGVARTTDLYRDDAIFGLLIWPFAGMVLVASNLAASRSRRHQTQELFDSLPATRSARSLAHALSLIGPMVIAAFLLMAVVIAVVLLGGFGRPSPSEMATGVLLVGCAGAVGILFERVAGRSFPTPLVVLGIGLLEGLLASGPRGRKVHMIAPWTPINDYPRELWIRAAGWHLVYIAGIGGILVSLAILRDRRSRRVAASIVTAVAVAAVGAWMQLRLPTRAEIARDVAFVAHPETIQRCEQHSSVRYCAYPRSTYAVKWWRPPVEGVLSRVPRRVRDEGLLVRQRVTGTNVQHLEREVRTALPFTVPTDGVFVWPDDGAIHPDFGWCSPHEYGACELKLAMRVASWAVGFPLEPMRATEVSPELPHTEAYDSSGQARAVVAVWLAGVATPGSAVWLRPVPAPPDIEKRASSYRIGSCDDLDASVAIGPAELAAARMLLGLPSERVASMVAADWSRLVDPRTKTAEIVRTFGLGSPLPPLLDPPAVSECG